MTESDTWGAKKKKKADGKYVSDIILSVWSQTLDIEIISRMIWVLC